MKKGFLLLTLVTALACTGAVSAAELRVGLGYQPSDIEMTLYEKFFKMLSKYTGDSYRMVSVAHDEKIMMLMRGEIDIAMSVVENPKVKASVCYGKPYATTEMTALLLKRKARSMKDLNGQIACVSTFPEASAAESYGAIPETFSMWKEKLLALEAGRCAASFGYRLGHELFLRRVSKNSKLYKHEKGLWTKTKIELTYATTKEKKHLLGKLDRAIETTKKNGDFDELVWMSGG